jgi:hypothetical protein
MSHKVALLIPTTSKGREWPTMKESYLYNFTVATFLKTHTKAYDYVFYIGYDHDDPLYTKEKERNELLNLVKNNYKNITFKFIEFKDIRKGHVTKMWNILFKEAYDDGSNYFYQCGDDIIFHSNNWVKDSIHLLRRNGDIGIAGPLNNNARILTQVMVSRKHMNIFGYFFPEEIINWCCDDWYNIVYSPKHFFPLMQHLCTNEGGEPRYVINNNPNYMDEYERNTIKLRDDTEKLATNQKEIIDNFISASKKKK